MVPILSVPLKAMCSNMWARPVLAMGSCADPASTSVKKENTGASGRSQMRRVSPLESFFTVMRFSKEATSCAALNTPRSKITASGLNVRSFIGPPENQQTLGADALKCSCLDEQDGQKFEITWRAGKLSN